MKPILKKLVSLFLFFVIFAAAVSALAAEKDDFVSTEYVQIVGNNHIVDEMTGVPAYYNQYDRYWQCLEYIKRYYKEIFGTSISVNNTSAYVIQGEGAFEIAETPRPGDVVYWPSYLRRVNYGHVAIVKEYTDGVITLIEQNWRYNGKAAVARQIAWPSSNYYVYTLTGTNADKVRGELFGIWDLSVEHEAISVVSDWAADPVNRAAESKVINTSYIKSYSDPITRLTFCNMNAELLGTVCPELSEIPLLSGLTDGKTDDKAITREEAAVIIVNTVDLSGRLTMTVDTDEVLRRFKDADMISPEARDAMAFLIKSGVFTGMGEGMLKPKDFATTEQAVAWLIRTHDIIKSESKRGISP